MALTFAKTLVASASSVVVVRPPFKPRAAKTCFWSDCKNLRSRLSSRHLPAQLLPKSSAERTVIRWQSTRVGLCGYSETLALPGPT